MSSVSKQKRRYSCQSWNVAAKVVLIPDAQEDEEDEEFVTAFDHNHESDEETTEILHTCQEDISENSDTIVQDVTEGVNGTAKEILHMCARAQDKLRRSLNFENLPHDITSDKDIRLLNDLIHNNNEEDSDEATESVTAKGIKSVSNVKSSSILSKTIQINNDDSICDTLIVNDDDSKSETFLVSADENKTDTLRNKNNDTNLVITDDNDSISDTFVNDGDESKSNTLMIIDDESKSNNDDCKSNTFVINNDYSEAFNDESKTEIITEDSKTLLNSVSCKQSTLIKEVLDKPPQVHVPKWCNNHIISNDNNGPNSFKNQNASKQSSADTSKTLKPNCDSENVSTLITSPSSNTLLIDDPLSETILNDSNITESVTAVNDDEGITTLDNVSESDSASISGLSSVSVSTNHLSSSSALFNKIKQRYEHSTMDSLTLDKDTGPIRPKKVLKDFNLKQQPVLKYQNIPFPNLPQQESKHNLVKTKLAELQGAETDLKKDSTGKHNNGYSKPNKLKSNKNVANPKIGNERNNSHGTTRHEEKVLDNSCNFNKSLDQEGNKLTTQKCYSKTKTQKEKEMSEESSVTQIGINQQTETEPHIYEEIRAPTPNIQIVDQEEVIAAAEHVYDEIKQQRSKGIGLSLNYFGYTSYNHFRIEKTDQRWSYKSSVSCHTLVVSQENILEEQEKKFRR